MDGVSHKADVEHLLAAALELGACPELERAVALGRARFRALAFADQGAAAAGLACRLARVVDDWAALLPRRD